MSSYQKTNCGFLQENNRKNQYLLLHFISHNTSILHLYPVYPWNEPTVELFCELSGMTWNPKTFDFLFDSFRLCFQLEDPLILDDLLIKQEVDVSLQFRQIYSGNREVCLDFSHLRHFYLQNYSKPPFYFVTMGTKHFCWDILFGRWHNTFLAIEQLCIDTDGEIVHRSLLNKKCFWIFENCKCWFLFCWYTPESPTGPHAPLLLCSAVVYLQLRLDLFLLKSTDVII